MYDKKIIIPSINIERFYRICAFRDTSAKSIGLKEKSLKQYTKFRDYIFGDIIKAQSYSIFIDKLRDAFLSKIISHQELMELNTKPFNPMTIKQFFDNNNIQISNTSAKNLLSLLTKVHLVDQINIIKNVAIKEESEQDKQLLYYFLLRNNNFISIRTLKKKFKDHARKHKINDYILELWRDGKLDISKVDVPREICIKYGIKDIPPEHVKDFTSIETYRVRESGVLKARIMLQDNYKLFPLYLEGDER